MDKCFVTKEVAVVKAFLRLRYEWWVCQNTLYAPEGITSEPSKYIQGGCGNISKDIVF